MMSNLRGNWLLYGVLGFLAFYILFGTLAPKPYAFKIVAIMVTILGAYVTIIYARDAVDILWKKTRGEYGAHLKLVGVTFIALGLLYTGLWRAVWDHMKNPDSWTMTWHSSLGLVISGVGLFLVSHGPADFMPSPHLPKFFWRWSTMVLVGVICYALGAYLQ